MKREMILIAFAAAALIFSGCSKKMPVALPNNPVPGVDGGSIDGSMIPDVGSAGSAKSGKDVFQKGKVNGDGKYLGSDGVSKSGFKMLYFASDSYTLDDDQIRRLMSDLPKIKATVASGKILLEGNCDEFGTDEYNHALGLKRAKAVKSLLVNSGIGSEHIDTVSYGESNPTCTVDAPACHAKNRRVEINKL
jgi:peptidoglycan-associated lipoprotein